MATTVATEVRGPLIGPQVLPEDGEIRQLLLQVVFGWHALEHMLRGALKRLKGPSITQAEAQTITGTRNHVKVMKQIRELLDEGKTASPNGARIGEILDSVGKGRGTKSLMSRTNAAIHASLARSAAGREFYRRIGAPDEPAAVDKASLTKLVTDLNSTIEELDRLTSAAA